MQWWASETETKGKRFSPPLKSLGKRLRGLEPASLMRRGRVRAKWGRWAYCWFDRAVGVELLSGSVFLCCCRLVPCWNRNSTVNGCWWRIVFDWICRLWGCWNFVVFIFQAVAQRWFSDLEKFYDFGWMIWFSSVPYLNQFFAVSLWAPQRDFALIRHRSLRHFWRLFAYLLSRIREGSLYQPRLGFQVGR